MFPWFPLDSTPEEREAQRLFVTALCQTAMKQKRVTLTEKPLAEDENEKFRARCFLLKLGFIGEAYTSARKILLSGMSGNGSFLRGSRPKTR